MIIDSHSKLYFMNLFDPFKQDSKEELNAQDVAKISKEVNDNPQKYLKPHIDAEYKRINKKIMQAAKKGETHVLIELDFYSNYIYEPYERLEDNQLESIYNILREKLSGNNFSVIRHNGEYDSLYNMTISWEHINV